MALGAHETHGGPRDTILAVSSPAGCGAVCLIRLSGPRAIQSVAALAPEERERITAARGFTEVPISLCLKGGAVSARAGIYRAPRSYTREDMVELVVPGAPPLAALAARSLLALSGGAVRWAGPGELTQRAYLNGRMALEEAESVASLIAATSEAEAKAVGRSLRGELGARLRSSLSNVIECLALIEAGLDFPDEDLPETSSDALLARIRSVRSDLASLEASSALRAPDPGTARVVLWGLPNAGKSSLLNLVLGRRAAIASPAAGTTRDPVRGVTLHAGRRIEWIDLAGTLDPEGAALGGECPQEAPIWEVVRRLTRLEVESADLVLWVVDPTGGLGAALQGFQGLRAPRKRLVIQKSDLLLPEVLSRLPGPLRDAVRVSALERTGLDQLLEHVREALGGSSRADSRLALAPTFLLTARQEAHLELVDEALSRAEGALAAGSGHECAASDLRDAKQALEDLVGTSPREAVLDLVFSRFCIGK